jgi:oxaloacetate decarboxylase alpha subunit
MTRIEFVDQTLRDGHQSLWGMRMRSEMVTAAAPAIDGAGYSVVDCTGGNQFTVQLRHVHRDPWEALDRTVALFPRTPLRAGKRWNAVGVFGTSPQAIVDLFNRTLIKHGIRSLWLYDGLFNMEPWRRACKVVHDAGAEVLPAILFGDNPVLTDEFYAARIAEIAEWGFADAIYVEDAAGILKPERTRTLIPAMVAAAKGIPLELHCHNTIGTAPLNYVEAAEHGVRTFHTASRPLANGTSLPSIEATARSFEALGYETRVDLERLEAVADHFERIALQEGLTIGAPNEFDARVYRHQLPGGMTGTLLAQLAQHGLEHLLPEVLEEVPRVREELGHPISATPFSQLVGIQAVLNVSTGERWKVIPDEVLIYAFGNLGPTLAPIDPDVMERIEAAPRAGEFRDREAEEPTLEELRERYGGAGTSDEELLNRYMAPPGDLAKVRAAGPAPTEYRFDDPDSLEDLVRSALAVRGSNYVRMVNRGRSVTLRRGRADG